MAVATTVRGLRAVHAADSALQAATDGGENMIGYFHEVMTPELFQQLCEANMTYSDLKVAYPKPPWCHYEDAVSPNGMGCFSLVGQPDIGRSLVHGRESCVDCDEYIPEE